MKKTAIFGLTLGLFINCGMADAALFSDFWFAATSGTSFVGSIEIVGVNITFSATDAGYDSNGGMNGFRAPQFSGHSEVNFVFDRNISEFYLDLYRVQADEITHDFNIGAPTDVSGTLHDFGGGAISTWDYMGDSGSGRIGWTGLNTSSVSFVVDGNLCDASNYSQFGFATSSVPEPSTLLLVSLGGAAFSGIRRYKGRGRNLGQRGKVR